VRFGLVKRIGKKDAEADGPFLLPEVSTKVKEKKNLKGKGWEQRNNRLKKRRIKTWGKEKSGYRLAPRQRAPHTKATNAKKEKGFQSSEEGDSNPAKGGKKRGGAKKVEG